MGVNLACWLDDEIRFVLLTDNLSADLAVQ